MKTPSVDDLVPGAVFVHRSQCASREIVSVSRTLGVVTFKRVNAWRGYTQESASIADFLQWARAPQ